MLDEERTFAFSVAEERVREIRKSVRRVTSDWGFTDETADTAELLVSELVTNVLLHGGDTGICRVTCARSEAALVVSVTDEGCGIPVLRDGSVTAVGGRGLLLVDSFADNWGVRPGPYGKATYFVLSEPAAMAAGDPGAVEEPRGREAGCGTGHDAGTARAAGAATGTGPGRAGRVRPALRPTGRPA